MNRYLPVLLLTLLPPAYAGMHDNVGFSRLRVELGDQLPTGADISIGQVESFLSVDHDADDATPKVNSWLPDPEAAGLRGVTIVNDRTAPHGAYSGHATAVARLLVGTGRNQGMVSAVDQLRVFTATGYMGTGLLQMRRPVPPLASSLRVVNHSWAGSGRSTEVLRRTDWLTDQDEVIQVVGVRNASGKVNDAYMAAAANAIVVGRTDGNHSVGTPQLDRIYPKGRTRPHLVSPLKTGSAAAPVVASAVALLLDIAATPDLSEDRKLHINRGGARFHDAGRSEVMRAILMAGASRTTANSGHADITGYRDSDVNRTSNGLDRRYGAGQLNVYNAWEIFTAGEQSGELLPCGFDYVADLSAGSARSYLLPVTPDARQLAATVSWNLRFSNPRAGALDLSAQRARLQLHLYETGADAERLVASSASEIDTTQTIYQPLQPGRSYRLQVSRADRGTWPQDYAVAWHIGSGS